VLRRPWSKHREGLPPADIVEWVDNWNEDPQPFVWHKTADEILERLGRYCADLTNTELSDETT
jgi:hypothetical protein